MIVIEKVGVAIALDGGRKGRMHQGVPWGGPLVPELFVRANRAVGNADDAVAIEVFGSLTVRAESEVTLSTERADPVRLRVAETFEVQGQELRARYLAIKGGVSPGALRKGQRLVAGKSEGSVPPGPWPLSDRAIHVVGGPDEEAFSPDALERLCGHDFWIHEPSNRMGTRLRGDAITRVGGDERPSGPMVIGAIQVPADGSLIVLGPDHPTTGGYPVLAVIATDDLGLFHSRPVGYRVRFQ